MYPVPLPMEGKKLENSVRHLHPTFLHWPPLGGPVYSVLPCTPSSHSEGKLNLLFISSVTSIFGPPVLLLLACSQTCLRDLGRLASISTCCSLCLCHYQRCCFLSCLLMVYQPTACQCQQSPRTHPATQPLSFPLCQAWKLMGYNSLGTTERTNFVSLFNLVCFVPQYFPHSCSF